MSTPSELYPLRLKPVYKDYLWGGHRIIEKYGRNEPEGIYAESWEVSDRKDGMSIVTNGPLAGELLADVIQKQQADLLGSDVENPSSFPLLIKLIDAQQLLSVQVHPDDESAQAGAGEAKTEMWYILDATPEASVYAGFKQGVDQADFEEAVEQQTLERKLVKVPVQTGDAVFTPGGRVHAIGEGCLVLEVQQNSNTTFRIYDWGRVDVDGNARDLHIQQALEVMKLEDDHPTKVEPRRLGFFGANALWEVLSCPYFRMERIELKEDWQGALDGRTFHYLFMAGGRATLTWDGGSEPLEAGHSILIPAALPGYVIEPEGGDAEVIRVTVP